MGGRAATIDGVLQPPYRAIALGSAIVLVLAAWIVLGRADTVPIFLGGQALACAAWVVAGVLALNTVTNLSGRHPLERWGMAQVLGSNPSVGSKLSRVERVHHGGHRPDLDRA